LTDKLLYNVVAFSSKAVSTSDETIVPYDRLLVVLRAMMPTIDVKINNRK